ncbi:hypothetical protein WA556_007011 [Blastocystis sp. ATCC 50177/Nand II]
MNTLSEQNDTKLKPAALSRKREAPVSAWSYFFDDHKGDYEEYGVFNAFVAYVDDQYKGELKQILYPLFKCIILFNEVREKEQKREFFEKYASKLTTSANESEMRILRQYVNGMALGFFKSTLDQWKCDPIPLTLSSRAVTLLKNVLEGEVLRGMQDYLVSKFQITVVSYRKEDPPLFQLRKIAKQVAVAPFPQNDVQQKLESTIAAIPSRRRVFHLHLSQFISSSSLSILPTPNESHIMCSAVGRDGLLIAVATEDSRIHFLAKDPHATEDNVAYDHTLFVGHSASVTALCFSADNAFLFSASLDGSVCMWSTKRRCCLTRYAFTALPLWCLQLSHRNDRFACGGLGCSVLLGSTAVTTAPDRIVTEFRTDVSQLLFSPNDKYLFAAEESGVIRLINLTTGLCERLYDVHVAARKLELLQNGTLLIVGDENGTISVFNVRTADLLSCYVVAPSPITGLVVLDSLLVLASCESGKLVTLRVCRKEQLGEQYTIEEEEEYAVTGAIHDAFPCGMNTTVVVEYDS